MTQDNQGSGPIVGGAPKPAFNPSVPGGGQVQMAANIQPAGFWIRFVASIIDGILLSLINYPVGFAIGFIGGPENIAITQLVAMLFGFALAAGYYGYFYTTKGASLGKLIFNMRVVNPNTGTKVTWGQAILRETLGKFLSGITLLIGYLIAAFRQDKKALHDLIASTQVLRKIG